ncbi:MAG: 16S rRNA (guanine(966)-N(2))-methyltransferase RsmD [Actinomycetaceae bacterium]|nr:16S rRNA (guanine(966)-N(2))-methyltransferase RsmD [Actinomycetaceae bacterium]
MARIVSGKYGGMTLRVPDKGTRPTSERVREAVFSRLESWDEIEGASVLDLFAGSGALGLEALSRGAFRAVFVDQASGAYRILKDNISRNRIDNAQVVKAEALRFANSADGLFSLVFIDPPYDFDADRLKEILVALRTCVTEGALIVLESSTRTPEPDWPDGYVLESSRKWGETRVWFITFTGKDGSVEA